MKVQLSLFATAKSKIAGRWFAKSERHTISMTSLPFITAKKTQPTAYVRGNVQYPPYPTAGPPLDKILTVMDGKWSFLPATQQDALSGLHIVSSLTFICMYTTWRHTHTHTPSHADRLKMACVCVCVCYSWTVIPLWYKQNTGNSSNVKYASVRPV